MVVMKFFSSPIFQYAISIFSSLGLIIFGFKAVFYPRRLMDYYLRAYENSEFVQRQMQKKWYVVNLKICGAIAMLMGLAIFIYIMSLIIKKL